MSKALIEAGAGSSLPLARPEMAVSGAMVSACAFQKDPQESTIQTKDQSLVTVLGNSRSRMGLILSRFGRMPVDVVMWPDQGASDFHQWHFDALIEKSCCSDRWRTASTVLRWSVQLVKNIPKSSMCTSTSVIMSENNSSIAACAHNGELRKPMGSLRHSHLPNGVATTHLSCD